MMWVIKMQIKLENKVVRIRIKLKKSLQLEFNTVKLYTYEADSYMQCIIVHWCVMATEGLSHRLFF